MATFDFDFEPEQKVIMPNLNHGRVTAFWVGRSGEYQVLIEFDTSEKEIREKGYPQELIKAIS